MIELPAIAAAGRRLIEMGEGGLLATLFGVRGPSYRLPGSMMLITRAGGRIGGVSGGCLEDYVAREGWTRTRGGMASLMHFDASREADEHGSPIPTTGCGGELHVLVERLTVKHVEMLEQLVAVRRTGLPAVLAIAIGATARGDEAPRRAVLQNEAALWDPAALADAEILSRAARVATTHTAWQGSVHAEDGERRILLHPIEPLVRLVVFGAGDDARAVARQAELLGWEVTVCDRRARLATRTRFPTAAEVHADDWERLLPRLTVGPNTAAIVMTHSPADDAAVLAGISQHAFAYVGLLGPVARRASVIADAVDCAGRPLSREFIGAIRGPAGIDLGLKSPEAIALSIAAEIIATLHGHDGGPLSQKSPTGSEQIAALETSS